MTHVFDPTIPCEGQDSDYDCSQESCQYALEGWGRTPDDAWMTNDWLAKGIMTPAYGLMDASGAGMAQWVNDVYGPDGMVAENVASVDFDGLIAECNGGMADRGIAAGGRGWCHWTGIRGFEPSSGCLLLANSAPGWQGIGQTMSRSQFTSLGPWSFVRVLWPDPVEPSTPTPDPPADPGYEVGSGLKDMMASDGTVPACPSTWFPIGQAPALIEESIGLNGVTYRWHLPTGSAWRYRPS